jgi:hypothetical protein
VSSFVDQLLDEDCQLDDGYDTQAQAQIESNLLDMLDDEPVSNFNSFEQMDAKSEGSFGEKHENMGCQEFKRHNSEEMSPASPSTQVSED